MAIRITSTRQAQQVQSSQRSKQSLGKKTLELGKEYAILFPKKDNEIAAAGIVGRTCDYDSIGVGFGRIADSQMDINPETGRIKDNSGMQRWASLSNILYKAAMAKEISDKTDEAKKIAEQTGSSIDEAALSQAIAKVKLAYEGQPRVGDEAAIMPTKQRLVSSSVNFSIFTEAVLIPLDKQLKPEFDKAIAVEVRLSNTKQQELNTILDNPSYHDVNDPDGFLEIKFSYTGKDAQAAGKNSYQGVEASVRKVNLAKDADGAFIDSGTKSITHLIKDTTNNYDIMFSRAGTVSFAQTAADVEAGMRKFLANNRMLPLYIDLEDEATKRNATNLIELGIFREGTKQYNELQLMIEEQKANDAAAAPVEELPAEAADLLKAKSTQEVQNVASGNAELQGMLKEGDGELADI